MLVLVTGCATAPKTQAERQSLIAEADATVATMTAKDPTLRGFIDRGHGYAVFPSIGKGGLIVGGAYGRGIVYDDAGRPIGNTELNQASIGAQIGGQSYSQIIVFENDAALSRLKAGNFDLGAEVSAVALDAGAAGAARFEEGVAVFQLPKGGLMAAAAINGQKLNYQPMSDADREGRTAGGRGDASAYTVDQNLQPDDEIRLRTGPAAAQTGDAADGATSATDRTERRIEQRRDAAEEKADDKVDVKVE